MFNDDYKHTTKDRQTQGPQFDAGIGEFFAVTPGGDKVYGQTYTECLTAYRSALRTFSAHQQRPHNANDHITEADDGDTPAATLTFDTGGIEGISFTTKPHNARLAFTAAHCADPEAILTGVEYDGAVVDFVAQRPGLWEARGLTKRGDKFVVQAEDADSLATSIISTIDYYHDPANDPDPTDEDEHSAAERRAAAADHYHSRRLDK